PSIAIGTIGGLVNGATSYASPISTALAGLVRSYYPALNPEQVIARVKGSCDDVDALNPGKENLLGEGKLNARRALADINPQPDSEVRLGLIENRGPNDANGNLAVEPGELFSVNLYLRNWGSGPANANFTLSTSSPAVTILDNSEGGILPADGYYLLENAFSIRASSSASSQYVSFSLNTTADIPIVTGSSITFSILIHNGGIFVWEGTNSARDMSGAFIRDTLLGLGYPVVYGNAFPASFYSFDAAFLSFGSLASTNVRLSQPSMFNALRSYLEAGGRVYMEGAEAIGYDLSTYFPDIEGSLDGHEIMWPLLGIGSATDGASNPINGLSGVSSTPTAGMNFVSSAQTNIQSIDTFTPLRAQSREAFTESDYATVAVVSEGDYGQRSFVFSYALRELTDAAFPSTRANLVEQIMDFFIAADVTLPVELTSFTATFANQPLLSWQTASETQLLGYNLYRNGYEELEHAVRANPLLIMATGGSSGASYSFRDELIPDADSLYYWLEAISYGNSSQFFGPIVLVLPDDDDPEIPPTPPIMALGLHAYPNPFGSRVDIQLQVPKETYLNINIYNIKGQLVKSLGAGKYGYGIHHFVWDGRAASGAICADGIYLLELISAEGRLRQKLVKQ
ncbi:MAG: T9SS type A sorting domain-containing protein, partial [Candidatus Cloacimonetes bacterium]|nr:T9SS type A sorting domain-containing protein [Candidatus Cloacimonadota bacterium]